MARLLCLVVLLCGSLFAQSAYRKTPIPTLGGKATARHPNAIMGINNAGQVLGCSPDVNLQSRWYIWSVAAGLHDLGIVCNGIAQISDAGHAVISNDAAGAILWTPSGTQGIAGIPFTLNSQDQAVGYYLDGSGSSHAFLWQNSALEDLGAGAGSEATAINDSGQVVVLTATGTFFWTRANGMKHVTDALPLILQLNASGQGAGVAWDQGFVKRAVLVTQAGMQDMGFLSGTNQSEARSINGLGVAVGNSWTGTGPGFAFIWSQSQGMRNLNTLGGNKAQNWRAVAINDAGQVAINKKGGPAILLTPK